MECIICRKEYPKGEYSIEHIIPDSIGGGITTNRVCKNCNSLLGNIVDIKLTNNFITQLIRMELELAGKKGRVPNPFSHGKLSEEPNRAVHFTGDKIRITPKVEIDNKGNTITVSGSTENEVLNIAKKKIRRIEGLNLENGDVSKRIIQRKEYTYHPKVSYEMEIDVNGIEYALLKIAYEITFFWLGEKYLDDSRGKELSSILCKYISTPQEIINLEKYIRVIFETRNVKKIEDRYASMFGIEGSNLHSIVLKKIDTQIICMIKIFDAFEARVIVSEGAGFYNNIDYPYISFTNPKTKEYVEGYSVELINRFNKD
jgi:hypothetical protein